MPAYLRRRAAFAILLASSVGIAIGVEAGKFAPRPLDERLALCDAVVVGKLVALSTRAVSVAYVVEGARKADRWFDLGTLRTSAVLKGPKGLKKAVKVMVNSNDQKDMPWPSHPAVHEVGEEGVWLLIRDESPGRYSLLGPEQNPLPLASREEVAKMLKKEKR